MKLRFQTPGKVSLRVQIYYPLIFTVDQCLTGYLYYSAVVRDKVTVEYKAGSKKGEKRKKWKGRVRTEGNRKDKRQQIILLHKHPILFQVKICILQNTDKNKIYQHI